MKSVNDCVAVAEALSAEDRDMVLARVDMLRADGIGPAEAGRTAAQDLLAEAEAELAEFMALVREQHPTTFEEPAKPPAPPRARYFTNPSEYAGEPDIRFSGAQPKGRVSPASVVEQSVADGAARIAEYIRRGGVRQSVQVGLGGTPHVLRMLGYPHNGLVVDNSILDKVFLGKHKDETRKLTPRGLMEALHQPAAVWRSGQDLMLMLPLQGTEGAPIVAPLRVEGPNAQVKSIYELNPPQQAVSNLTSALQKGGVLYADIAGTERALQSKSPLAGAAAAGGLRSSGAGTATGQASPEVTPPGSKPSSSMLGVEVGRQNPQQAAPLTRTPDRLGNDSRARIFEQLRQAVNVGTVKGRGDLTTWIAANYIGPGEEMPRFSRAQEPFYSALARGVAGLQAKSAPGDAWRAAIKGLVNKGTVKADEVEWSGINEWLDLQQGKVSREQVQQYLNENGVRVEETTLGGFDRETAVAEFESDFYDNGSGEYRGYTIEEDDSVDSRRGRRFVIRRGIFPRTMTTQHVDEVLQSIDDELEGTGNFAKFAQYQLPGGENYREVLLTLPERRPLTNAWRKAQEQYGDEDPRTVEAKKAARAEAGVSSAGYRSQHWDQPNVLAHARLNDRTDEQGRRVLFVEEIQSDWGQEGKKKGFAAAGTLPAGFRVEKIGNAYRAVTPHGGYLSGTYESEAAAIAAVNARSDLRVPLAPFVTNTDKWLALALKRIVKLAVDGDYDAVAFVNGEQSADRYDLSKHIDTVLYDPSVTGPGGEVIGRKNGGNTLTRRVASEAEVADVVGKEIAQRLLAAPKNEYGMHSLSGVDLKVGGSGMRAFYDQIVPAATKSLLKKLGGGQMEEVTVEAGPKWLPQPGFDVTPAMREKAAEGLPLFSRRQGLRFTLPEFDKFDQGIERLQDRYNRWKQVVNAVREQGGSVDEINNFYLAEERYWGRTGAAIEDFQKEVEDWVKTLAADKLTLADVATYAYAKHAQERNAYIASIRPDMPDGGSGMSNDDAQAYLDDADQAGLKPVLDKHVDKLYEWIQGTRDVLYEGGLLSEEEWLNWSSMFQNYVPLRGLAGREDARGTGQGFNIRGKEGKRALGRFSEAANLVENILQDRARAYIRVGKNDVLKSFAKFVIDNPDPKLWQINAVENKPVMTVDANGDRIVEVKPTIVTDERTVVLKDAGKEIHILVNDPTLREQMKNLHQKDLPEFLGALLWINRQMARMFTSLNPVFTVLNAARDVQAATVGMVDDVGFAGAGRLWKRLPGAVAEAARAEFGTPSADYQLFRATGGKTGFFIFGDVDQRASELSAMVADANRGALNPIKLGRKTVQLVESVNAVIENATRFAAWQAARESGKSVAEASSISKNITVNFNRKGTATNAVGAWFLFFNPAVQGTARMLKALRNPKVLTVLGAGMTAAAALAMRNADMGEDDDGVPWWDKIPDEVKERNMVFVLPPGSTQGEGIPGSPQGRYIKVPMPYGYNFFAVLANQVADVMRNMRDPNHGRTATAGSTKALNAFLGSWLPTPELGRALTTEDQASAGKSFALFVAPDVLSPIMQVRLNQNAFGRKLFPDDPSSRNLPDSAQYFTGQEGTVYQRTAEELNRLSGGGAFRSGFFNFSPATIENLIRGYGGGPASFVMDSLNVAYARQSIERPEWEWRRAPFAKQLYGVIDDETDRMTGYERMREAEAVLSPLQKAKAARNFEEVRAIKEEHPALSRLGKDLRNVQEKLTTLRKQELAVLRNDDLSDPEKYARMQKLNARRREALNLFTKRFDSLTQAQADKEEAEEAVAQP